MRPSRISLALPLAALAVASCGFLRFWHDERLGEREAEGVSASKSVYPDSTMRRYVARVGRQLEQALDSRNLSYKFTLLDDEELNAFALPGGYVYVTRAVLAAASSDDELAAVMAHEMMHAERRHRAQKTRRALLPNTLKIPGRVAGAILGEGVGDVVNAPVNLVSGVNLARYSRSIEKDADLEAVRLLAAAGYDPNALATILTKFAEIDTALTGEFERRDYLSTHPYTPDRAASIRQAAARAPRGPGTATPEDHLANIDGLLYGRDPRRRSIRGRHARSEELGLSIRFPAGWEIVPLEVGIACASRDGEGLIYITPAPLNAPPQEIGPQFAGQAQAEFGGEIYQARSVNWSGVPGYVVSLRDDSGPVPAFLHLVWIRNKGETVQIVGMGTAAHQEQLRATGQSIRAFLPSDRKAMTKLVIATAQARPNESLTRFCQRTGNQWSPTLTAAMNGLPEGARPSGLRLKIAVRRPAY